MLGPPWKKSCYAEGKGVEMSPPPFELSFPETFSSLVPATDAGRARRGKCFQAWKELLRISAYPGAVVTVQGGAGGWSHSVVWKVGTVPAAMGNWPSLSPAPASAVGSIAV